MGYNEIEADGLQQEFRFLPLGSSALILADNYWQYLVRRS
jgi:hypothetical protein